MKDPLFFIALLPGEAIEREVTAFKQACARLFHASHALKSPPHITLIPPFPWNPANLAKLADALDDFAARQSMFPVELHDFDCFKPRVIFIKPLPNEQLDNLQATLESHLEKTVGWKDERSRGFHPHLTIAHRDLKHWLFPKAREHFSAVEYRRTFDADRLTLLEHLKGRWEIYEEYFFGK
jgi:2'-5' RNA ligase